MNGAELPFLGLVLASGAIIAFQSPINGGLGKIIGSLEASLMSFVTGTVAAILAVLLFGKGNLRLVSTVAPWQLTGGILGLMYVTAILVAVPRIGVSAVIIGGLIGQIVTALIIDHHGWFGVPVQPVTTTKVAAVGMALCAMYLLRR